MSHHNLVNLLDVGVEGEYRYLVLEYVNGNTLKDIIRQKGRLNYQTAIQITIRILSALQHAHDNGIIHRDIKPQNVLIHADGHVKVSDFGIARMTNAFTISKGDTVVGSVHYSSPEQATGSVVEATSDIYSTGRGLVRNAHRPRALRGGHTGGRGHAACTGPAPAHHRFCA